MYVCMYVYIYIYIYISCHVMRMLSCYGITHYTTTCDRTS